jgi:hypothetical protein
MSRYLEAPAEFTGDGPSLFLACGITSCPDWQADVVRLLADLPIFLLNPRRADFPIHDPSAAQAQIEWEHLHLRRATAILFWFPCETLCPISLYELGAWSMIAKPLFVGVHPNYQRRRDVEIQTRLARPDLTVVYSLADLVSQARSWFDARVADDSKPSRFSGETWEREE